MNIHFLMAWRNIWRNRRRSLLTISAIAFAVTLLVFMLSFQFGSYETMINAAVRVHTGYFQVQAEEYQDKQEIRLAISDPEAVAKVLDRVENVTDYTFRAAGFSLAASENRSYGVMVTGIDPEGERRVSTLASLIREGEYLAPGDTDQAVLGGLLARNLKLGIGDEVTLLGQGWDGSVAASVLKVKGIFRSGQDDFDRNAMYMPLSYFQEVFALGGRAHQAVVITESLLDVSEAVRQTSAALSGLVFEKPLTVLDWRALLPGLAQGIKMDLSFGIFFYMLLILVVAFSIMNTFLMAIFERTREFGVLMALGTTPGRLTRLLLTESMTMTILGLLAGMILGGLLTWYFQIHGIDFGEGASEMLAQYGISGRMYPRLSWLSLSVGPVLVFIITFWAALYPAVKVKKLKPVEALTYI